MSSRERDSSDFDLERFVDLFDTAMNSDNPAVQRALKNLLMITTLVDSDLKADQRVKGPLRRLVDDLQNLNRRISQLEHDAQRKTSGAIPGMINTPWITTQPNTGTPPPQWVNPTTGTPNWPPGTIIGGGTGGTIGGAYTFTSSGPGASSTAYDDQFTVGGNDILKQGLKDYD